MSDELNPDPAEVDNGIAQLLTERYGFLPLTIRNSAARQARYVVQQYRDQLDAARGVLSPLAQAIHDQQQDHAQAVRAAAAQYAFPVTPPAFVAWSSTHNCVCRDCGAVVQQDMWDQHQIFHMALGQLWRVQQDEPQQRESNEAKVTMRLKLWHSELCDVLGMPRTTDIRSLFKHAEDVTRELAELRDAAHTLADAFARTRRGMTTSGRQWNADALDAWLYALFVGWDCTEDHEHQAGVCNVLDEVAATWNFSQGQVADLRHMQAVIARTESLLTPAGPVDRAAVEATLTAGFEDDQAAAAGPCPSIFLRASEEDGPELLLCQGKAGHYDPADDSRAPDGRFHWSYRASGGRNNWDHTVEVPQPWPVELEPPVGIDLLHDVDDDQSGTTWLHRMGDGWEWTSGKELTSVGEVFPVPWAEAVSEAEGRPLVVVKP